MSVTHLQLRNLFSKFWEGRGHKLVPPIPLVPKDDPTTLFTGSGMQQLVPYLLGEPHPLGNRLYNIQRGLRTQDIEEVGDNRHTTLFEMMGNWSLGDYFKKEQLDWFWNFLTQELTLPKQKLYVTVFAGTKTLPRDIESAKIWKKLGVQENRIFYYGPEKNWWSRAGIPDKMPAGEPGGPDSEVFYEFTQVTHNTKFGPKCHPNCDCGRFLEIANSVFMQYKKEKNGTFSELPKKNVDFGGGLERIIMAAENKSDMFTTSLFTPLIKQTEFYTGKKYGDDTNKPLLRIIADHLKASVFLIKDGVRPSNKEQGYILRRLLRRPAVKIYRLTKTRIDQDLTSIVKTILNQYEDIYFDSTSDLQTILPVINNELIRFGKTLERGIKEISKIEKVTGKLAFDLYQSYGFPLELTEELLYEKGQSLNHTEFAKEFQKHKNLSRTASSGMFKGGLADQSNQVLKYHTATHLLHQALFDVLGDDVRQEGSNITSERLRFDFSSPRKPTAKEIEQVEASINKKIQAQLSVSSKILSKDKAYKIGAKAFFKEKYPEKVKVYFIGTYSKEFCGGPHVKNTRDINHITLYKLEKIGSSIYRIYAK